MFKRTTLLLVFVLGLLVVPMVGAQQAPSVFDIARYYPQDTVAFVSFNVDDATLDAFDTLGKDIARRIGSDAFLPEEEVSLRAALDEAANEIQSGATYESLVGAWLGDRVGVGIIADDALFAEFVQTEDSSDFPYIWTAEITDSALAEEFVAYAILESNTISEVLTEGDFTIYSFLDIDYQIAITPDVMFGGTSTLVSRLVSGDSAPLSDFADFNEIVGMVPEPDYSIGYYMNTSLLLEMMSTIAQNDDMTDEETKAMLNQLEGINGMLAGGFTMVDGRSLVMDIVQTVDMEAYAALGLSYYSLGTIDPTFAQRLPLDTPLLLQLTNLKGYYELSRQNLEATAAMSPEVNSEFSAEAINEVLGEFENETGINVEQDIISWLSGDIAVFIDMRKDLANATNVFALLTSLPVEFGIVADASADPATAAVLIDKIETYANKALTDLLASELNTTEVSIAREEIAQANALVITITDTQELPFPIELVIASNDEVFTFGTRESVRSVLLNDGGLASNPIYTDALDVAVADPYALAYINFPSLQRLVGIIAAATDEPTGATVDNVLSLFEHWTSSSNILEDGTSYGRLSITLAGE